MSYYIKIEVDDKTFCVVDTFEMYVIISTHLQENDIAIVRTMESTGKGWSNIYFIRFAGKITMFGSYEAAHTFLSRKD